MTWGGEGVDPWLPERIAAEAGMARSERDIYKTWLGSAEHWLSKIRPDVLAGNRPDPGAVFKHETAWRDEVAAVVDGPVKATMGDVYETIFGEAYRWDLRPAVARHLSEARNRMQGVPDEVFSLVSAELARGAAVGESLDELTARVEAVLSTAGASRWDGRAATVARTEMQGARQAARADGYWAVSLLEGGDWDTVWISQLDSRVRPTHFAADDQRVPLGQPYVVGGVPLRWPGDPLGPAQESINCRCDSVLTRAGQDIPISTVDIGILGRQVAALTAAGKGPEHWPAGTPGGLGGQFKPKGGLAGLTVPRLREVAKELGVQIPARSKKDAVVGLVQAAIEEHGEKAAPSAAVPDVAAERALRRAAARERQRIIERGDGTARLLAHVDELLGKDADMSVIRAQLDPALIEPEQLFGNADPDVLPVLVRAVDAGDRGKLRAALTRLGTKAGIKPVGKAGARVSFDPDQHETFGDATIRPGDRVLVVRRGSTLTLADGETVRLDRAQVVAVEPAPRKRVPARPKPTAEILAVPVPDSPYGSRQARVAALVRGEQVGEPRRMGGSSAVTTLYEHTDGSRTVGKVYQQRVRGQRPDTQEADAEELAPLVLEAFGLIAPATVRVGRQEVRQEFVEGDIGSSSALEEALTSDDGVLLGLADTLMINSDRNEGNWIRTPDGRIAGVDHGFAFLPSGESSSPFAAAFVRDGKWVDNDLTPADIAVIRTRLEALAPEFDRLGRGSWHRRMMRRLDQVAKRAFGRRNRVAAAGPTAATPPGEVVTLPRVDALPTATAAAHSTNPNYGSTASAASPTYRDAGRLGKRWVPEMGPPPSGAFEENCTNAVFAFELRMRGFDVQAAPLDVLDRYGYAAGRTHLEMDAHIASSWILPDGGPHGRSFAAQEWRSFAEIDKEVESWPEGGRGFVTVDKHVFSVVKSGGKAKYVEAQFDVSPTRDVTTQYKKKYRDEGGFSGGRQEAKVIRLDDLVPTRGILDSVVVV